MDRVGRFLPITVKTMVITQFLPIRQKYFLPRGEMAERGETKFGENCHENTQLKPIYISVSYLIINLVHMPNTYLKCMSIIHHV